MLIIDAYLVKNIKFNQSYFFISIFCMKTEVILFGEPNH